MHQLVIRSRSTVSVASSLHVFLNTDMHACIHICHSISPYRLSDSNCMDSFTLRGDLQYPRDLLRPQCSIILTSSSHLTHCVHLPSYHHWKFASSFGSCSLFHRTASLWFLFHCVPSSAPSFHLTRCISHASSPMPTRTHRTSTHFIN